MQTGRTALQNAISRAPESLIPGSAGDIKGEVPTSVRTTLRHETTATTFVHAAVSHIRALARSPYALVVVIAALLYSVSLSTLSFLKYYTFNATYSDLGLENHTQWLLSHGWIANYYASGFSQIYSLQYEKPVLFLITPLYALYPQPTTLLILGSFVLGLAAIPLYVFAARRLKNRLYAMVISLSYLVYFPIASANLFDFHEENFFPLFFFTMIAAWSLGRTKTMYFAAALTAMVDPLCLVITAFFLYFTALKEVEQSNPLWIFVKGTEKFVRSRIRLLFTIGLALVLLTYYFTGYLFTPGVGGSGGQTSFTSVLFFDINSKLETLIYLYAALAFIPLFAGRAQLVILPYIGYVLYSTNSANWAPFGLMYTLLGAAPLYLALVEAIRSSEQRTQTAPDVATRVSTSDRQAELSRRRSQTVLSPSQRMVLGLTVASLVFGVVYFPYSPANQEVTGGYFNGNHDLSGITDITPQVKFLWKVIDLIPASASVLSQNDIPEVTGREYYQEDASYDSKLQYDYLLMDSSFDYFSPISVILPIANADLQTDAYGVVAEGQGALLLSKGYSGLPELFQPSDLNYSGSEMTLFSGTVVGSTLVNNASSYCFWYGPYVTLYPGQYRVEYVLESNLTTPATAPSLGIDVVSGANAEVLDSQLVTLGNFSGPGVPTIFTETFNLTTIVSDVQFRGMGPTGVSTLTLLGVYLQQLSGES